MYLESPKDLQRANVFREPDAKVKYTDLTGKKLLKRGGFNDGKRYEA